MREEPTTGEPLEAVLDFREAVAERSDDHDRRFDAIDRRLGRLSA